MGAQFVGDVHAPAAARRFVAHELGQSLPRDSVPRSEDVVLVVSELVTNAVRAGAAFIGVDVTVEDSTVQLRVTDDAPGWPALQDPDWDDLSGRGLAIVDEIADEWHTSSVRTGKHVVVRWSRQSDSVH